MSSLNKAILIGRAGSDPETRATSKGTVIAKLPLATNYRKKGEGGAGVEEVEWHRLTFFARLADVVKTYVRKGDRIYVEGRIEYNTTEGDDGQTRYWTDIVVNNLVLLGSLDAERGAVPAGDVDDGSMPF